MRFSSLLILSPSMGIPVSQKDEFCIYEGRKCVWTTSSPIMCGNTAFDIGDLDEKMLQLVTWTNGVSIGKLCAGLSSYNNPGRECCTKYGSVCLSGYKRLWCDRARVRIFPQRTSTLSTDRRSKRSDAGCNDAHFVRHGQARRDLTARMRRGVLFDEPTFASYRALLYFLFSVAPYLYATLATFTARYRRYRTVITRYL